MVSTLTCVAVICGPHEAFKSNLWPILDSSLYYAFARTAWSWAVGWMVFACATGRGGPVHTFLSWSAFGPLSSLSYLAYLTHPLLMIFHTGRIRERIYFGHYEMVCIFLSRLVMTFGLAYLVHVIVEVPFASVEHYMFPKRTLPKVSPPMRSSNVDGNNNHSNSIKKSATLRSSCSNSSNSLSLSTVSTLSSKCSFRPTGRYSLNHETP